MLVIIGRMTGSKDGLRTGWAWWNRPKVRRVLLAGGLSLAGLRVFDPWTGWVSNQATESVVHDFGIHLILYQPSWGYAAILVMCALTPLINRATRYQRWGIGKRATVRKAAS